MLSLALGNPQKTAALGDGVETAYRIVIAHRGLETLAKEVENAVKHSTRQLAGIADLLEFSSDLSNEDIPQVLVYLGNAAGRKSKCVRRVIDAALEHNVSIIPVFGANGTGGVTGGMPKQIRHLNAVSWSGNGVNVATSVLGMLGIVETERKVFISYRQSQTSELAVQLHTALAQRRFDVFLDRFSIKPGADFQRRLEEDLGDKAFMLLLESSDLHKSSWVRHEIAYAHAHRIEILALTHPHCRMPMKSIDEAFRWRLSQKKFSSKGILSAQALQETLEQIELAHARALRRRREQILGSVTEKLRIDGCTCNPVDDWCVLAMGNNGHAGLFWVTPRRPEPRDFHSLNHQRQRVMREGEFAALKASVIHESGRLAKDHQKLLKWLSDVSNSGLGTVGTCSL